MKNRCILLDSRLSSEDCGRTFNCQLPFWSSEADNKTWGLRMDRAPGIAGLARHAITKLVQAASADPTTEFSSDLSVWSPWWCWQKCIKQAWQTSLKLSSEITKVSKVWQYHITPIILFRMIPGWEIKSWNDFAKRFDMRLSISSSAPFFKWPAKFLAGTCVWNEPRRSQLENPSTFQAASKSSAWLESDVACVICSSAWPSGKIV